MYANEWKISIRADDLPCIHDTVKRKYQISLRALVKGNWTREENENNNFASGEVKGKENNKRNVDAIQQNVTEKREKKSITIWILFVFF